MLVNQYKQSYVVDFFVCYRQPTIMLTWILPYSLSPTKDNDGGRWWWRWLGNKNMMRFVSSASARGITQTAIVRAWLMWFEHRRQ